VQTTRNTALAIPADLGGEGQGGVCGLRHVRAAQRVAAPGSMGGSRGRRPIARSRTPGYREDQDEPLEEVRNGCAGRTRRSSIRSGTSVARASLLLVHRRRRRHSLERAHSRPLFVRSGRLRLAWTGRSQPGASSSVQSPRSHNDRSVELDRKQNSRLAARAARYCGAMTRENVTTVQLATAAINDRDVDAYLACCVEDVELHTPVSPVEGAYRGTTGIRRFFSDIAAAGPTSASRSSGSRPWAPTEFWP
jgi:hypothetical protein